jgi:hypothetical protein
MVGPISADLWEKDEHKAFKWRVFETKVDAQTYLSHLQDTEPRGLQITEQLYTMTVGNIVRGED